MKLVSVLLLGFILNGFNLPWLTDFAKATAEAKQENKMILLNFSGSDWCTSCVRMHQNIFASTSFETFANGELVLVNADFPRLKKHQLSKGQQQQNEALAGQYNPSGKFPYTLLINTDGKVVKAWEGCPNESAEAFVQELKTFLHD